MFGKRRFLMVLAAVAGLVFAVGVGTAGAAPAASAAVTVQVVSEGGVSAAAECFYPVQSPDGGALVCWNPTGEHLYICDTKSDGHHPASFYFRSDSGGVKEKHADVSAGNCLDHNLSLPESGWVNYQACNFEGSRELSCSAFSGRISANG